jgi:hypothetical protein
MKTLDIIAYSNLSDEDKAFMDSFKETHDQYGIPDSDLIAFLNWEDISFDGYTQVADARNLWRNAIAFARGEK